MFKLLLVRLWGTSDGVSVGVATLVSDESGLVSTFSAPTDDNSVDFHSAAYFLRYSNSLFVVRECDSDAVNALGNNASLGNLTAQKFNNLDAFEASSIDSSDGAFIAKYPAPLVHLSKFLSVVQIVTMVVLPTLTHGLTKVSSMVRLEHRSSYLT